MPNWSAWPFEIEDPYRDYRAARADGPVQWLPDVGVHVVLSHEHARSVLSDVESYSSDLRTSPELLAAFGGPGPGELFTRAMLTRDPPEHTRLRQAVNRFFTPRAIRTARDRVAAVVAAAIEPVTDGGTIDVIEELARPIPLAVIAELFDVGVEGAEVLSEHTPDLIGLLELNPSRDLLETVGTAAMNVMLFLVPIVAERRRAPGEDLISALLHPPTGQPLESDEIIQMCLLLLAAGHVTTSNLIGNGTLALLREPDQLAWLAAHPDRSDSAVEELLRYDGPAHIGLRIASHDTELGGSRIREGDQVLLLLGAANRDPAQFDAPDSLRLDRHERSHLAFGHGTHFCLGAGLARLEGAETFARLAGVLARAHPFCWTHTRTRSRTFRGLATLQLESETALLARPYRM